MVQAPIFPHFIRARLRSFRLSHPKPTPHGIRRGGASWHLQAHGSYDRTVEHGRWATVRSARIYINEAAAEQATIASSEMDQRRLEDAVKLCPSLFTQNLLPIGRFALLIFPFVIAVFKLVEIRRILCLVGALYLGVA